MHCNYCYATLGKPHMSSCKWGGLVQVRNCNQTEGEPMDPQKLNLSEQGRRYDHYMELKEWAMTGLDVIERSKLATEGDKRTKAKLEAFVEVLDRRIRYLADWDHKIFSVASVIRSAGIHRTPLIEGAKDEHTEAVAQPNPSKTEDNQADFGDVT